MAPFRYWGQESGDRRPEVEDLRNPPEILIPDFWYLTPGIGGPGKI
jgi:hypothetical protein